jgi:CBS domain-containing protein
MAIGEVCSRGVVFALEGTSVRSAAQLMREFHVGTLVVVAERDGRMIAREQRREVQARKV